MKKNLFFLYLFMFSSIILLSQVKIGDNPNIIHGSSILELESTDKALVISRVNNSQMYAIKPLNGAIVYNTDEKCVFLYNGTNWKSLCSNTSPTKVTTANSAPTINNTIGDFWINDSENNATSIWDGTKWISIDNNPKKGSGVPNNTTVPNAKPGDVYVNQDTGRIYAYDGTSWISTMNNIKANNGLILNPDNTVQLGGTLIKPTIFITDKNNTINIKGLEQGDTTKDDIVTVNRATGQLKKINPSNLLREEITRLFATNNNQVIFSNGFTLKTTDKINVYRNGVRIDFTVNSNTQITLEPEAKCYVGDEIKIIQLY